METKLPREVWESHYRRMQPGSLPTNPQWVEPYYHILELKHVKHVLEIGCGGGDLLRLCSSSEMLTGLLTELLTTPA